MSMTNGVLTVLPAPEGYVVDFANPARTGDVAGYWVTAFGIGIAAIFLTMRMYTKVFITRNFSIDDAALLLSWAFGIAVQTILTHFWVIKATGVHAWEIPLARYQFFNTLIMVASILYVPALGFAKLSILILYRKLSQLKWFNVCVYLLVGIVLTYSTGIIFALIFPCKPIAANWDLSITDYQCIDKAGIYLATASVNVITDVLILALPIPMVLNLNMPKSKKIGLIVVFAVGSATLVTSVVRLVLMIPMVSNMDQTWAVSLPCIWINIEANLVIICVSLPALRPFLKHFLPRLVGDDTTEGSSGPSFKKNSELNTFGSVPISRKKKYGRMHDESVLEMTGNFDDIKGSAEEHTREDDDSERAIWQTRTVTVEYGRGKLSFSKLLRGVQCPSTRQLEVYRKMSGT